MKCFRHISLLILLAPACVVQAQTADEMREDTMLFEKPVWGFWAGPTMVQALELDGLPVSQNISPRASFFGHLGADYTYPFGIRFGLRTGLQVACAPLRTRFDLLRYPTNGMSADMQGVVLADYSYWYADIPVQLEFRRRGGRHHYQVFRFGGLAMLAPVWKKTFFALGQDASNGGQLTVYELNLESASSLFVRPGLSASVGLYMVQVNHHLITLNLSGRYLFKPMLEGSYRLFIGTADDSSGSARLSGNYIGFELGYSFTRFDQQEKASQQ
ncbi:MAG: hypothetical protein FD123_2805 [Bacteroidetes bacterium]|nr:MAG: hypothetical protein FD123_2805 [Bacteroidota bacterium]